MDVLYKAKEALQTRTPTDTSADEHQQLLDRLTSHFEAGTSTEPAAQPEIQQLRAQKLALSLLSRGLRLPQSLLDEVGGGAVRPEVRLCICVPPCTSCDQILAY